MPVARRRPTRTAARDSGAPAVFSTYPVGSSRCVAAAATSVASAGLFMSALVSCSSRSLLNARRAASVARLAGENASPEAVARETVSASPSSMPRAASARGASSSPPFTSTSRNSAARLRVGARTEASADASQRAPRASTGSSPSPGWVAASSPNRSTAPAMSPFSSASRARPRVSSAPSPDGPPPAPPRARTTKEIAVASAASSGASSRRGAAVVSSPLPTARSARASTTRASVGAMRAAWS